MKKILNLKLVILLGYQNIKIFLPKLHSELVWKRFAKKNCKKKT